MVYEMKNKFHNILIFFAGPKVKNRVIYNFNNSPTVKTEI